MFNEYDFIVNNVLYYYADLYKDVKYNMAL